MIKIKFVINIIKILKYKSNVSLARYIIYSYKNSIKATFYSIHDNSYYF